jgi:mannose-6-phosphate isomerase-like protein (cupin superfamily)
MHIKKLKPIINISTLEDGRGGIYTFLPETIDIKEWSYIITLKGAERGKHYHKEFDEYIMFVEGSGVYLEVDDNGLVDTMPVASGDCIFIPAYVGHTFKPNADCKAVALITKRWDNCKEPITRVSN